MLHHSRCYVASSFVHFSENVDRKRNVTLNVKCSNNKICIDCWNWRIPSKSIASVFKSQRIREKEKENNTSDLPVSFDKG